MTKIIGISGWSGSGKTSIIEKLIKIFKNDYGLNVSVIKHAHESFKIDHKGKDSFKFSEAGAKTVIISSKSKWVLLNNQIDKEPELYDLINIADNQDIILVEGWKHSKIKKIEVYRNDLKKPFLHETDKNYIAIATNDNNFVPKRKIFVLNLNNEKEVADFIIKHSMTINAKV